MRGGEWSVPVSPPPPSPVYRRYPAPRLHRSRSLPQASLVVDVHPARAGRPQRGAVLSTPGAQGRPRKGALHGPAACGALTVAARTRARSRAAGSGRQTCPTRPQRWRPGAGPHPARAAAGRPSGGCGGSGRRAAAPPRASGAPTEQQLRRRRGLRGLVAVASWPRTALWQSCSVSRGGLEGGGVWGDGGGRVTELTAGGGWRACAPCGLIRAQGVSVHTVLGLPAREHAAQFVDIMLRGGAA